MLNQEINSELFDNFNSVEFFKDLSNKELLDTYTSLQTYGKSIGFLLQDDYHKTVVQNKKKIFTKELAREKLIHFCAYTKEDYEVNDHHEMIAEYLDLWVAKKIDKLIITCPPQTGKSELSTRRLPAYILGKEPDANVMIFAHTSPLARDFNRDIQKIIDSEAYFELFPETRLFNKNIRTLADGSYLRNTDVCEIVNHEGSFRTFSILGGAAGKSCKYLIIDDPIKGALEAFSPVVRSRIWNEYITVLRARLGSNKSQLLLTTRWNEDDLVGRLLKEEPGQWIVVNFPMIKDTPLNHNDYDFRDEGEPLWGNKFSLDAIIKVRENTSRYWWASIYQGRPTPEGGSVIKEDWFERYDSDQLPVKSEWVRIIQSWDTAFEEKQTNDFSVCTSWLETKTRFYLLHVWRGRVAFPELKRQVPILYEKFHPPGDIGHEVIIEKKASGHSLIQELRSTKIPVKAINVDRSKKIRLEAASPTIESGKVLIPYQTDDNASWLVPFLEEIVQGLNGAHDDQIDTMTQAINYMKGNATFDDFIDQLRKATSEVMEKSVYDNIKEGNWDRIEGVPTNIDTEQNRDLNAYEQVMNMR